jgi:4-methyl-5(b-hydroxyethyl)-thiazole monophosphate biosynthesis
MSKKVLVPVADGTEELEAVSIIDCLRRAGAQVTVASVQNIQISTSRKIKITADCLIKDCAGEIFDLIALPGGMPGAEHLRDCPALTAMLSGTRFSTRLSGGPVSSMRRRLLPIPAMIEIRSGPRMEAELRSSPPT